MAKKVLIIGMDDFGRTIAKALLKSKVGIEAIDKNQDIVENAANELDNIRQTDATDVEAIKELRIERFDTIVVAIGKHNSKDPIVIVHNLHLLGAKHIIARGHKGDADILKKLGADRVVVPETEAALSLAKTMIEKSHDVVASENVGDDKIIKVSVDEDSHLLGTTIEELAREVKEQEIKIEIKGIEKANGKNKTEETPEDIKPQPDYILELGDNIVIMGEKGEVDKLSEFIEETQQKYEEMKKKIDEKEKDNNKKNGNGKNHAKKQ